MDDLIRTLSIYALPVLLAITLHEAAHAWVAYRHGDSTAYDLGRVSLNPLRHIDLVGTILVPGIAIALGGFLFGWAKAVPVDFKRLIRPIPDSRKVALAGPVANLFMAIMWLGFLKLGHALPANHLFAEPLTLMANVGVQINVALMIVNMLPILPLDGGRVLFTLLPRSLALPFARLEPYGFFILLILIMTKILDSIMLPLVNGVLSFFRFFL